MAGWNYDNLQTITDVIPALVSYFDADHVCRFANNYHRYWYGRPPGELVGLHMREFLGDEGYARRTPYLERVSRGEEVAFDAKVPYLDHTVRDASIRYVPHIRDGKFEGFYILVFDTAILQHRFHSVFDGTALSFLELDVKRSRVLRAQGRPTEEIIAAATFADFNTKAALLFGISRGEALGASISHVWPSERADVFISMLEARDSGAASLDVETVLRKVDGTAVDVLINCTFPKADGLREMVVLGLVDLTDRNHRDATLAVLQNELAHASRVAVLGELTASIAHEVNQPLGAIVNNGNAALRWLDRPEPDLNETRRSIELLVNEAKRASDIIRRARELAKKGTTDRSAVEPAHLIHEATALVARQVSSLGATIFVDVVPNLPAVYADRVQLQQVLVNLLINAAQEMDGQAAAAEIHVSANVGLTGVLFAVEDTGAGISADERTQLFDPFFTTKAKGMGIGLSVSKTIVEAHGGTIGVKSSDRGGARFEFSVPLAVQRKTPCNR